MDSGLSSHPELFGRWCRRVRRIALRVDACAGVEPRRDFPVSQTTTSTSTRPSSAAPGLGRARVLCVDDDRAGRHLLGSLLTGFDVVTAADLDGARRAIVEHRPCVVITEAWVGGVCAAGFVADVLGASTLDVASVIVLSGDASAVTAERFGRLGVHAFLPKPAVLAPLLAMVSDLAPEVHISEGNPSARTIAATGN
jgi:CheY-like chemotaxis protein